MSATIEQDSIFIPSEDVVAREIEGEIIIVPITLEAGGTDEFFSLNEIGRIIWNRLDGRKSVRKLIDELTAEFESRSGQIENDVTGFLSALFDRRMISKV